MPFFDYEACEPLRIWDRLEPRAREVDFDTALEARVHDGLWMLARQWQMGEFHGEDTGTAVLAKLARRLTPVVTGDGGLPLEAEVEPVALDRPPLVRARLGRRFLAELDAAGAGAYRAPFAEAFEIAAPADPGTDRLARAQAVVEGRPRRVAAALAGRAVDGVALRAALSTPAVIGDLPTDLVSAIAPGDQAGIVDVLEAYRAWYDDLHPAPAGAWVPGQLEYQTVGTAARDGGTVELTAAEHVTGRLDWHGFDQGEQRAGPSASTTEVRTVIPVGADFAGMPNPRWWQLEDAAVDLGGFSADATDLAKVVVAEFALVYGNNWLVVPYGQPVGTLAEIDGVLVTDTFGHRTLVSAATSASAGQWTAWDLFSLSPRTAAAAPPLPQHLFLPACAGPVLDGAPLEQVAFVRDESADMVWGVELRVPDGLGASQDGTQAARRLTDELAAQQGPEPAPAEGAATLRYRLGTEVAESWIPFIPVQITGGTRAIRLQRAAMPRIVNAGEHVRPRTEILRPGLDAVPVESYFLDEEEVPRAGVRVSGAMRRARWTDGRTVVWHGRTVNTGRGEADSGLAFDSVETIDPRP